MTTFDNRPPRDGWVCDPRPCPEFLTDMKPPPLTMPDCWLGEN